ncbi:MAG: biotin transporter BioY [Coriobacteriia bacterium]|nr:biotin transporter BioY [Coriobacteriia bacterium]
MSLDTPNATAFPTRRSRTRELVSAALVAALMAATSWIQIKFGPVPFTLQTVFVVLAALLLAPEWAAASMGVYLVLGAVGLPVFAGGVGGFAAFTLPTGGFLVAFPVAAGLGALAYRGVRRAPGAMGEIGAAVVTVLVVEAVIYAIGIPWLVVTTGMPVGAAAGVALLPFLVPDAIKAAAAVVIATAVRRASGD